MTRSRPYTAKWPIVLECFIKSGLPAMAIDTPSANRAGYIVKVLRHRYHAEEQGVDIVHRGTSVYIINTSTIERNIITSTRDEITDDEFEAVKVVDR